MRFGSNWNKIYKFLIYLTLLFMFSNCEKEFLFKKNKPKSAYDILKVQNIYFSGMGSNEYIRLIVKPDFRQEQTTIEFGLHETYYNWNEKVYGIDSIDIYNFWVWDYYDVEIKNSDFTIKDTLDLSYFLNDKEYWKFLNKYPGMYRFEDVITGGSWESKIPHIDTNYFEDNIKLFYQKIPNDSLPYLGIENYHNGEFKLFVNQDGTINSRYCNGKFINENEIELNYGGTVGHCCYRYGHIKGKRIK